MDKQNLVKVKAVQDDSCHWYIIPNDMLNEFYKDLENGSFVDGGGFSEKYSKYMTGGCINNTQLFADIE